MIAALFALAAAMIIGGCAAVIQGFPYVRLESGLAMVIAGSVAASSGAVLAGLGVIGIGLRRVERAIEDGAPLGASGVGGSLLGGPAPVATDSGVRGGPPPVLPAAPTFVPPVVQPALDPERPRSGHGLGQREAPFPSSVELPKRADAPGAVRVDPEPRLPQPPPSAAPEPVFRLEPEAPPRPARAPTADDDLFAAPAAPGERTVEMPPLRPALDAVPEAEPAPKPATRTVVGRYASGGNTYVMFEDGSIEAETPQGRFTFASLDELKAFVDGGGEAGTRGAA
jgi:hypothetical protein